ncbi:MAG: sulfite exporter TauE/SafE family protein [Nitrososphaerota archaeon]|nr:sulfite exporter TauE/SafE family protein [Candidatus Bathyarchaeota archaeon]MDW8049257.1 sulfite exporter TauE/SafE family protein [Nitrososphaerota archaeon]
MPALSWLQWVIIIMTAVSIGLTKTGIPGLSILFIPLMAEYFPAKASTGIVLPLLMLADVFAVIYYRKNAIWHHLLKLLPWTSVGVVIGYVAMGMISDAQLKPIIGAIILIILMSNFWFERNRKSEDSIPQKMWFAAGLGIAAGVTTMMANAAGTIFTIYLLTMKIPKTEFVGTSAWFFFILNWFKFPFSVSLGLITLETLHLDFMIFPAVAAGAITGILLLKKIPESEFRIIVQVLAALAAINLLI